MLLVIQLMLDFSLKFLLNFSQVGGEVIILMHNLSWRNLNIFMITKQKNISF